MKKIVGVIVVIIIVVSMIKFVPPINDIARENLPASILNLIGEKPKGLFEKGLDRVNGVLESLSN